MAKDKDAAKPKDDEAKGADKPAGEGEAAAQAKKKGLLAFLPLSRKMLMFVVAPAALGVVALAAGLYFFVFTGEETQTAAHGEGQSQGPHPVFLDVPEILVNLATSGEKPAYLKLAVSLEVNGEEARVALEPVMPRVIDQFQTYLRELRVEDLSGSAAMFRLKEELMRRVNLAVEPAHVEDVLFKEMIVQ